MSIFKKETLWFNKQPSFCVEIFHMVSHELHDINQVIFNWIVTSLEKEIFPVCLGRLYC